MFRLAEAGRSEFQYDLEKGISAFLFPATRGREACGGQSALSGERRGTALAPTTLMVQGQFLCVCITAFSQVLAQGLAELGSHLWLPFTQMEADILQLMPPYLPGLAYSNKQQKSDFRYDTLEPRPGFEIHLSLHASMTLGKSFNFSWLQRKVKWDIISAFFLGL
jgi:hypothetical protein